MTEGMIISVPHTGTRSLRDYLELDGYWHFGQSDSKIEEYDGPVHFPVRDPFDVSISWHAYYGKEPHRDLQEFQRWELAFKYLKFRHSVTYYRIDQLPVHVGRGPDHVARHDRSAAMKLKRIQYLLRWIHTEDPATFFGKHFPEGFSWLT